MSTARRGYIFEWADTSLPPLAEALNALREERWLPENETWWCAWNELEILLPQRLGDPAALPTDWDELRVFSGQVEFRQVRQGRGWRRALLAETDRLPSRLSGWQALDPPYWVVPSLRILWGRRLRTSAGEQRGEVLFPRSLAYDLAGEVPPYDQRAVVADVQLYYDAEARLRTTRYAGLRHLPPGADIARVQPLSYFRLEGGPHDTTT